MFNDINKIEQEQVQKEEVVKIKVTNFQFYNSNDDFDFIFETTQDTYQLFQSDCEKKDETEKSVIYSNDEYRFEIFKEMLDDFSKSGERLNEINRVDFVTTFRVFYNDESEIIDKIKEYFTKKNYSDTDHIEIEILERNI